MSPDLIQSTADYASRQSDRWLFVAILLIGIVAVTWIIKYFSGQVKESRAEIAFVSTAFNRHLIEANREMLSLVASCKIAIEQNTSVINRVERKLPHNE